MATKPHELTQRLYTQGENRGILVSLFRQNSVLFFSEIQKEKLTWKLIYLEPHLRQRVQYACSKNSKVGILEAGKQIINMKRPVQKSCILGLGSSPDNLII